jgi:hypothetical protein
MYGMQWVGGVTHISLHSLQPWDWGCVAELIVGSGMTFAMDPVGRTSGCDTSITLLRASSMDSVSMCFGLMKARFACSLIRLIEMRL